MGLEQNTSSPIASKHLTAQVDSCAGVGHVQSVPCSNGVPPAMVPAAKGRKSSAKHPASEKYVDKSFLFSSVWAFHKYF